MGHSLSGPNFSLFASMTVVKFEGLPLPQKFVGNLLLGMATIFFCYFDAFFPRKICPKNSLYAPTFCLFASMTVVKFKGLPRSHKWRYWAENSFVAYYWEFITVLANFSQKKLKFCLSFPLHLKEVLGYSDLDSAFTLW